MSDCQQYDELASNVDHILEQLVGMATMQLELFRAKKPRDFRDIDRAIENVVGEKERRIGALRQHAAEHGCQQRVP